MLSSTITSGVESTIGDKKYFCINCNEDCRGIIGSSTELEVNESIDQFRTITVLEALEFVYDLSWDDFSSNCSSYISENYSDKNNDSSSLSTNPRDILKSVSMCGKCTPILAEFFKHRKHLEQLCSSESLLLKAKEFYMISGACRDNSDNGKVTEKRITEAETQELVSSFSQNDDGDRFSDNDANSTFTDSYESNDYLVANIKKEINYEPAKEIVVKFNPFVSLQRLPSEVVESIGQKMKAHSAKKKSKKIIDPTVQESSKRPNSKLKGGKVSVIDKKPNNVKEEGCTAQNEANLKIMKTESLSQTRNKRTRKSQPLDLDDSANSGDCADIKKHDIRKKKKHSHTVTKKVRDKSKWPCNKCDDMFPSFKSLQHHRGSFHAPSHPCSKCSQTFSSLRKLTQHKAVHKIKAPPGPYPCDHCDTICSSYYAYKYKHMVIHTENARVICDLCGKSLSRNTLREHKKLIHCDDSQRSLLNAPCPVCGKVVLKYTLKKHMALHDEARKLYQCNQCEKVYLSVGKWRYHIKSHSLDSESIQCKICRKICSNEFALKKHIKIHTKAKSFACDQCNKSFRENYALVRHQVMHETDRPFACEDCGRTFKSSEYLTLHEKNVHGKGKHVSLVQPKEEDVMYYNCNICSKTFLSEKGLLRHQPYHYRD